MSNIVKTTIVLFNILFISVLIILVTEIEIKKGHKKTTAIIHIDKLE